MDCDTSILPLAGLGSTTSSPLVRLPASTSVHLLGHSGVGIRHYTPSDREQRLLLDELAEKPPDRMTADAAAAGARHLLARSG